MKKLVFLALVGFVVLFVSCNHNIDYTKEEDNSSEVKVDEEVVLPPSFSVVNDNEFLADVDFSDCEDEDDVKSVIMEKVESYKFDTYSNNEIDNVEILLPTFEFGNFGYNLIPVNEDNKDMGAFYPYNGKLCIQMINRTSYNTLRLFVRTLVIRYKNEYKLEFVDNELNFQLYTFYELAIDDTTVTKSRHCAYYNLRDVNISFSYNAETNILTVN